MPSTNGYFALLQKVIFSLITPISMVVNQMLIKWEKQKKFLIPEIFLVDKILDSKMRFKVVEKLLDVYYDHLYYKIRIISLMLLHSAPY